MLVRAVRARARAVLADALVTLAGTGVGVRDGGAHGAGAA